MDFSSVFSAFAGQMAQGIAIDNPKADQYTQLAGRLLQHAVKWAAVSQAGFRCALQAKAKNGWLNCGKAAICSCVICKQPVCFEHSMVSPRDGTGICFACVGRAEKTFGTQQAAAQDPANRELLRERYLRVLGLIDPADDTEIRKAFQQLSKKYHPDKFKTTNTKKRAEKKFKSISEAYNWLMQQRKAA